MVAGSEVMDHNDLDGSAIDDNNLSVQPKFKKSRSNSTTTESCDSDKTTLFYENRIKNSLANNSADFKRSNELTKRKIDNLMMVSDTITKEKNKLEREMTTLKIIISTRRSSLRAKSSCLRKRS